MKKRSLFFDTGLIYFCAILYFVFVRILVNYVSLNGVWSEVLNISIQIVGLTLIPFLMYKFLQKKKTNQIIKEFNIKPINAKAVGLSVLLGVIVYFLTLIIASFFNSVIYGVGYDPSFGMATATTSYSTSRFLLDIFVSAVLPGICEEFCHRGMLLNGCKQLGVKKAIILVGLLFGLMHLNITQFFYATLVGIFLTFLVYITGSIIPSMIIHFMNNAIGIYLSFAQVNNLPFGNFSKNLTSYILSHSFLTVLIGMFFVVGLLCLFGYLLVISLLKATRIKQFEGLAKQAIANKEREEILKSFNIDPNYNNDDQTQQTEQNMPNVVFINDRGRFGKRAIVDINFAKNMLYGKYDIRQPALKEQVFWYGSLVLGVLITIATFIWGIL